MIRFTLNELNTFYRRLLYFPTTDENFLFHDKKKMKNKMNRCSEDNEKRKANEKKKI